MSQHQQQTIRCLICNQMEQRRTLIGHISEHIGLKPHACEHCDFQTAFENEAMDHEADNFGHHVSINAIPYHSRICRFIYNDCDFADRNNCNLDQVLDRPLGNNRARIVAPATSTISSALSDNVVSNSATSAIVYNGSKQMRSSFINNVNSNNNELAISSTTAEFSPRIEPASHQQLYPPSSPIAVAHQYASEQAVASSADILDIKPLSITETVRSHSRTSAIVEIDEIHENEPDHQRLMPVQPGNIAAHVYVTEVAEQSQQQQPQKSRGRPISRCGYVRRQPRKKQMRSGDVVRRKSYVLRSQLKALMR